MEFNYLYGKQAEQFAYVNIPKALIHEEAFSDVSLEAKMLYEKSMERNNIAVMDARHTWSFPWLLDATNG